MVLHHARMRVMGIGAVCNLTDKPFHVFGLSSEERPAFLLYTSLSMPVLIILTWLE